MADSFVTEAFTLLAVGVTFVIIRQATRIATVGFKGLWADDYLMVFAVVVYGLETGTAYCVGAWWHGLANNGMTDEQRLSLSPEDPEYALRVGGSKTQLVGWSLYTLLLWTLKLCLCFFYSRLTLGLDFMRSRVRVAYAVVVCTYLATELSVLFGCHPFHKNWQIYPDPGNYCQPAVSHIDLYVTVVLNVVSDAYLLSIPLPLLWQAELPLARKVSLVGLFSGAIFVMAAAILRCALIITDPLNGAQAAGSWAVRETFVAVMVANIPIVYQGYRKLFHARIVSTLSRTSQSRSSYVKSKSKEDHEMAGGSPTNPAREAWLIHPPTPLPFAEDDSQTTQTAVTPAKFA